MSQYDNLYRALQERAMTAQSDYDQAQIDLAPYQRKMQEATTQRFRGMLPGLIEMAYDAHKLKKIQPEHDSRLKQALEAKYGLDGVNAELQALEAARIEDQRRSYEEQKAARDQGYKSALQSQKDAAAMDRAKLPKAPAANVNVYGEKGPTPFQEAADKKAAESYSAMQTAVESIPKLNLHLSKMEEIANATKTGRVADVEAKIGEWLGTDTGTARQVWNSQMVPQLLELAKAVKGPMTEREWAMLERALPQFGFSNEANQIVIGMIRKGMEGQQQNFRSATEYSNQNGHLRGWEPPYSIGIESPATSAPQQTGSESEFEKWKKARGLN